MSWGTRKKNGNVGTLEPPRPIDPKTNSFGDNAGMKSLEKAVVDASAESMPGSPNMIVPALSIANFKPPQDAIDRILGGS